MTERWMTSAQAASSLGVSVGRVRQLLASGQLPGRKIGRDWLIPRMDLERYRALPAGVRGHPKAIKKRPRKPPPASS